MVTKYQKCISGPLLDRIDIHIEAPRVDYEKLSGDRVEETSEAICARVQAARDIQQKCFSNNSSSDIICNADMRVGEIRRFCKLQDEGHSLMRAMTSSYVSQSKSFHKNRAWRLRSLDVIFWMNWKWCHKNKGSQSRCFNAIGLFGAFFKQLSGFNRKFVTVEINENCEY